MTESAIIRTFAGRPAGWSPWCQGDPDRGQPRAWSYYRAPAGTPIPDGCEPATPGDNPVISAAEIALTAAWLRQAAASGAPYWAQGIDPDDPAKTEKWARRGRGDGVHEMALWAPLDLDLGRAVAVWTRAGRDICSAHTELVVRPDLSGYRVWRGLGGMMVYVGGAADCEAAVQIGLAAIVAARAADVPRTLLAGWHDDAWTRLWGQPAGCDLMGKWHAGQTVAVHRGPAGGSGMLMRAGYPASSWDLPVVELRGLNGDVIASWPERVTWDDEASRAVLRERQRQGELAHRESQRTAGETLVRQAPDLAAIVQPDGSLRRGAEVRLRNGMMVRTLGPTRMREDGRTALALVDYLARGGDRIWCALGEFA